jgi:hypothetical protein
MSTIVQALQVPLKLCKNCVHFIKSDVSPAFALCRKYAKIEMVYGKVDYPFAGIARIYQCKGVDYSEEKL